MDGPVAIEKVQADGPISSRAQKYQPELFSQHVVLADPSDPYGRVLEGPHIILDATCIGFKELTDSLKRPEGQQVVFQARPVLDQSLMFDYGCCRPRSAEIQAEIQAADMAKFTREIEHHVCIALKFDDWNTESDAGCCFLLLLKRSDEDNSFTRVGYMTVTFHSWNKPVDPYGTFDALGWERRKLKLI